VRYTYVRRDSRHWNQIIEMDVRNESRTAKQEIHYYYAKQLVRLKFGVTLGLLLKGAEMSQRKITGQLFVTQVPQLSNRSVNTVQSTRTTEHNSALFVHTRNMHKELILQHVLDK
jgi:hypothetical protein